MPKGRGNWFGIRPICSDLRIAHVWGGLSGAGVAPFSPASGGIWRSTVGGEVGSKGRNHNAKVLPRCGQARTVEPFRVEGRGVGHTTAVLLLLVIASLTAWCIGPETVIQKRVSEVRLTLIATDQNDRPVEGLSAADITVLEDGRPIPRFELRAAADLTLHVAILVDVSDSTRKSWGTVRSALSRSLPDVMRPDDDVVVIAFHHRIELERRIQAPGDLGAMLSHSGAGGLTALYDAIYQTCASPLFAADGEPHRSALILFSDGEDDLSAHGLDETIARAERSGIVVYTISTHSRKKRTAGDAVLHSLAKATGGKDFVVRDASQLGRALNEINGELRSSYLLYYRAWEQPGVRAFRRVHVIPTQNGAHVRSREGYYTTP